MNYQTLSKEALHFLTRANLGEEEKEEEQDECAGEILCLIR